MIIEMRIPVVTTGERVICSEYFGFRTPVRPPMAKKSEPAVAAPMFSAANADPSSVAEAEKVVAHLRNYQARNSVKSEPRISPREKRDLIREEALREASPIDIGGQTTGRIGARGYYILLGVSERELMARDKWNHKRPGGRKPRQDRRVIGICTFPDQVPGIARKVAAWAN